MIGIDLVFIPEFRRQVESGGAHFLERAFNPSELENQNVQHLAGLWAAKEAVIKAAPESPERLIDVAVTYDASGRPHGNIEAQNFEISISHHGEYVVAVAMGVAD
jgi:phosphopantetheine--protein transferase-like protein